MEKLSFIIIDDSELDCFIARKFIEHTNRNLTVSTYQNARLVIEQMRKSDLKREIPLTIILLDLRMPVMNGFQFVDDFEKLPIDIKKNYLIYILSSTRNTNDIKRILTCATVHGMIEKPLTREKIIKLIADIKDGAGN
ncbi:MAG: response regulator [Mucilaginibacter sp.]